MKYIFKNKMNKEANSIELVSGSEEEIKEKDEILDIRYDIPSVSSSIQDITDLTEPLIDIICLGDKISSEESESKGFFNQNARKRISSINHLMKSKKSKTDIQVIDIDKNMDSKCDIIGCNKPWGVDPIVLLNKLSQSSDCTLQNNGEQYNSTLTLDSEANLSMQIRSKDEASENGNEYNNANEVNDDNVDDENIEEISSWENCKDTIKYTSFGSTSASEAWQISMMRQCFNEHQITDNININKIKTSNDVVQISSDEDSDEEPNNSKISKSLYNEDYSNELVVNVFKLSIGPYQVFMQSCVFSANNITFKRPNSEDCFILPHWILNISILQENNFFVLCILLNSMYASSALSYFLNFDVQTLFNVVTLNNGIEILLYSNDCPISVCNSINLLGYQCNISALNTPNGIAMNHFSTNKEEIYFKTFKRKDCDKGFYRKLVWPYILLKKREHQRQGYEKQYEALQLMREGIICQPQYAVAMDPYPHHIMPMIPVDEPINCTGFSGDLVRLFTYPPPPASHGINLSNIDLFCLNDGEYLNDVIIDFYLKYLSNEVISESAKQSAHFFSSFFYSHLISVKRDETNELTYKEERYAKVKRWTRNVDLFSKDFIIIPINESYHWFLAIICFPNSNLYTRCRIKQSNDCNELQNDPNQTLLQSGSENFNNLNKNSEDPNVTTEALFSDNNLKSLIMEEYNDTHIKENTVRTHNITLFKNSDEISHEKIMTMEDNFDEIDKTNHLPLLINEHLTSKKEVPFALSLIDTETVIKLSNAEINNIDLEKFSLNKDIASEITKPVHISISDELVLLPADANIDINDFTSDIIKINTLSNVDDKFDQKLSEVKDTIGLSNLDNNSMIMKDDDTLNVIHSEFKENNDLLINIHCINNIETMNNSNFNSQIALDDYEDDFKNNDLIDKEILNKSSSTMPASSSNMQHAEKCQDEMQVPIINEILPQNDLNSKMTDNDFEQSEIKLSEILTNDNNTNLIIEHSDDIFKENKNECDESNILDQEAPINPCILIFDSLKGESRYDIAQTLRDYLQLEWQHRKCETHGPKLFDKNFMKGSMVNCPQQPNSYDCGLYVLQYVESFFKDPIKDYLLPLNLSDWFSASAAVSKRHQLAQLILSLTHQLNPQLQYDPKRDGCLNIIPFVNDSEESSVDDDDDDDDNDDDDDENSSSYDSSESFDSFKSNKYSNHISDLDEEKKYFLSPNRTDESHLDECKQSNQNVSFNSGKNTDLKNIKVEKIHDKVLINKSDLNIDDSNTNEFVLIDEFSKTQNTKICCKISEEKETKPENTIANEDNIEDTNQLMSKNENTDFYQNPCNNSQNNSDLNNLFIYDKMTDVNSLKSLKTVFVDEDNDLTV